MLKQLRLKIIRNCQFRKIIAMGNFVRYVIHRLRFIRLMNIGGMNAEWQQPLQTMIMFI